jgi:hypothetical protein
MSANQGFRLKNLTWLTTKKEKLTSDTAVTQKGFRCTYENFSVAVGAVGSQGCRSSFEGGGRDCAPFGCLRRTDVSTPFLKGGYSRGHWKLIAAKSDDQAYLTTL